MRTDYAHLLCWSIWHLTDQSKTLALLAVIHHPLEKTASECAQTTALADSAP